MLVFSGLRLVNDQDHGAASVVLPEEELVESVQGARTGSRGG